MDIKRITQIGSEVTSEPEENLLRNMFTVCGVGREGAIGRKGGRKAGDDLEQLN